MQVSPISNVNSSFRGGLSSKIEKVAATLPTKVNANRKSIPIEYHNALVKLTAWRVFFVAAAAFGLGGFKASDIMSDKEAEDFSNAISIADIDTEAPIEIKDLTHDGSTDLILTKKDGSKMILDLKNLDIYTETSGFREVE